MGATLLCLINYVNCKRYLQVCIWCVCNISTLVEPSVGIYCFLLSSEPVNSTAVNNYAGFGWFLGICILGLGASWMPNDRPSSDVEKEEAECANYA